MSNSSLDAGFDHARRERIIRGAGPQSAWDSPGSSPAKHVRRAFPPHRLLTQETMT
jgi:hypothetical protein